MKCVICKQGETKCAHVTELLERNGRFVIVKGVPVEVCEVCGEVYAGADVTARLLELGEEAMARSGEVILEKYSAA